MAFTKIWNRTPTHLHRKASAVDKTWNDPLSYTREYELFKNRKTMNTSKLLIGVLAGMAVGAALGILFAPHSGENTRKAIAKKGEDYLAELECRYEDLLSKLTNRFKDEKEEVSAFERNKVSSAKEYTDQLRESVKHASGRLS